MQQWGFRISSAYGAPNSRNWFRSVPAGTSFVVASIRLQVEHSAASQDEEYLICFFQALWPETVPQSGMVARALEKWEVLTDL